jgi:hypothetical protein
LSKINSLEKALLEKLMHGLDEDDFLCEENFNDKKENN